MSGTRVLLVRHPETEANAGGRYVGRGETALTAAGEEQAEALVGRILSWDPDALLSSPSERCLVVARRVSEASGVPLTVLDSLTEMDFGLAEGLTFEEASRAGISIDVLGGVSDMPFEGGEAWDVFTARVEAAAAEIERAAPRVAVVTHGGVIRALLTHWLGLPDDAGWRFSVPNGGVADVLLQEDGGLLVSLDG